MSGLPGVEESLRNPLGMTTGAINDMLSHAQEEAPREACGVVIGTGSGATYMPCDNVAEDPEKHFEITPPVIAKYMVTDKLTAVVHSHPAGKYVYPYISANDMQGQVRSGVPWGVIHKNHEGVWSGPWFWGTEEPAPLIGRPFIHGICDCYSLARDWFKIERDVILPDIPRDPQWWEEDGPNLFDEGFEEAGFRRIEKSEIEAGDGVIGSIMGDGKPNHCGVYLGDNLLLHHLINRLSRRDPMARWSRYITCGMRYEG